MHIIYKLIHLCTHARSSLEFQHRHIGKLFRDEPDMWKEPVGSSSSSLVCTWEQQALSARGVKRVGRHSEYAI